MYYEKSEMIVAEGRREERRGGWDVYVMSE